MSRAKKPTRRRRAARDPQALLRQLQKALAVTKCIKIATECGEGDDLDVADAIAGMLILLEAAAALLDQPEGAP